MIPAPWSDCGKDEIFEINNTDNTLTGWTEQSISNNKSTIGDI